MVRLDAAVQLSFDFLPFYWVALKCRRELNVNKYRTKKVGGECHRPKVTEIHLACLQYVAFITPTNVGGQTNRPSRMPKA